MRGAPPAVLPDQHFHIDSRQLFRVFSSLARPGGATLSFPLPKIQKERDNYR